MPRTPMVILLGRGLGDRLGGLVEWRTDRPGGLVEARSPPGPGPRCAGDWSSILLKLLPDLGAPYP